MERRGVIRTKKQSEICKKVKGSSNVDETATLNEVVKGIKLVDPGYKCSKATYYYAALVNGTTIQSGTGNYSQTFVIE